MGFAQRVTRIKELSERRRLPRLGVIRLGLKKLSKASGKEYPTEVDYFVVPPEVQKIYGEKPKRLDVMLPLDEIDIIFPQAYKYYGSSKGLKCQGDGELAYRVEEGEMVQIECPCENLDSKKCKQTGTLMVMLPKVSVGGIYQIRTSSFNSIVDVNSGLDYVRALLGRFCMVPLVLERVTTETHHDEQKQNHYTLRLVFDADIYTLNALRQDTTRVIEHSRQYLIEAPIDENPELDPPDVVDEEEGPPLEAPQEEPPKMATSPQLKAIHTHLTKKGISDRDAGLLFLGDMIGRKIESSKELTIREANMVIDKMIAEATP